MNRFFLVALLMGFLAVTGCSGGGENTNVAANADAEKLAEYERMVAESEKQAEAAYSNTKKP